MKSYFVLLRNPLRLLIMLFAITLASINVHAESDHDEEHEKEHAEKQGEKHDEEGLIALSAEQLSNAGIELAQAGAVKIRETLPLYGVVALNTERMQRISARFPGVIHTVSRQVGDLVQPGDVLATVESDESLKSYSLTAAIRGVVTERHANVGEKTSDAPLFVIADLSTVWVELSLFPRDVSKAQTGQSVRVYQTSAQLSSVGKLFYLAPAANNANQALVAKVTLDNDAMQWVPGHFVSAELTLNETPVALAVRNTALQTQEGRTVVFVQEKEGFEARPVQLGKTDSEYTEILSGISANETYASTNSFILKSELGKESAEHGH
ncbi:MAG: efflux RND transporter periplasmic adaptor subunit [Cellvibrionales bacterium]|jgi:cobalt-zinc-cadmium efflux system membrane fusion protein|nr:efflux RND transporter periplasmic adaptor subunit [Cellvibrionales bacterium]